MSERFASFTLKKGLIITGKQLRVLLRSLSVLRLPGIVVLVAGGLLDGAYHLGHAVRIPGGYTFHEPLTHIVIAVGVVMAALGWFQPKEPSHK